MSSIPLEALLQDLTRWKALTPAARKKEFLLSEYAFLISTGTKKVRGCCVFVAFAAPCLPRGEGALLLYFLVVAVVDAPVPAAGEVLIRWLVWWVSCVEALESGQGTVPAFCWQVAGSLVRLW